MKRSWSPIALLLLIGLYACVSPTTAPGVKLLPEETSPQFSPTIELPASPTALPVTQAPPDVPPVIAASETPATLPINSANTLIDRIKADLAERLSISPDQVAVVSITTEELPLDNYGCTTTKTTSPVVRPAMVMAKIIILDVQGTIYRYHAKGLNFEYCGSD